MSIAESMGCHGRRMQSAIAVVRARMEQRFDQENNEDIICRKKDFSIVEFYTLATNGVRRNFKAI